MKKFLFFLGCFLLGPVLGWASSLFWFNGANTFWRQIDYFPLPVEKIIQLAGNEFWVEANNGALYHIAYPCNGDQLCWNETNTIPAIVEYPGSYKLSYDRCENKDFVYPLFHTIKMCITSTVLAPDAYSRTSLALTSDNTLWVWEKQMVDPFTILLGMMFSTAVGTLIGLFLGLFLAWRIR
jgi:ABC-type phosphate/phosphonate transport system permease subunit